MTRKPTTAILTVKVIPRSSRAQIVSYADGVLTVKLTAPPVEGAANAALVKLLADALDIRKSSIGIKSGEASRTKRLIIDDLDDEDLQLRLQRFAK